MRKLGPVVLVVVGLLVLAQAIGSLQSFVNILAGGDSLRSSLPFLAIAIVVSLALFALGSSLVVFRQPLSSWLFDDAEDSIDVDSRQLLRAAVALIGLYMIVFAVPAILVSAASFAGQRFVSDGGEPLSDVLARQLPSVVGAIARLFIGLGLVFGSGRIGDFLTRGEVPPVEARLTAVCPSCGEPYDPDDYSDSTDARCIRCHSQLVGGGTGA